MSEASIDTWVPPQAHDLSGMDREAAQAALGDLIKDNGFVKAHGAKQPAATQHWQDLSEIAYSPEGRPTAPTDTGNPVTDAVNARAELARLQGRPDWVKRYAAGGIDERATFDRLTKAAAGATDAEVANAPGTNVDAYRNVHVTVQPDDDVAMIGNIQNALQTSFAEAQIPPSLAQGIVQHIEAMGYKTATWTDEQYNNAVAAMEAELKREWGGDYEQNMKMAEAVLQRMKTHNAFISQVLADTGANISPWFIRTLHNLAMHHGVTA